LSHVGEQHRAVLSDIERSGNKSQAQISMICQETRVFIAD